MDNSFLHTKRLLLVDDEQELLKMVSDILKDAGFETVLTAMTVKEAILTAKEETPDLIVLDVMLPDGDGFSLMEQLRTIDKRRLETYIGHLEEQHIRRLNRALAVSVGLIEETSKNLIMCLCPACANNFYGTGSYYLRRVHPGRVEKDICTYCGQRPGFDYEVVKKKERK